MAEAFHSLGVCFILGLPSPTNTSTAALVQRVADYMTIRTGILHIPTLDQTASDAIRQLLGDTPAQLFVQEESATADQRYVIEEILRTWADERELDLIITNGATFPAPGPSGKESAPSATQSVLERNLPGLAEAMRSYAHGQSELAYLDCSVAGIRGRTLILNLPAGAAPAHLFLEAVVDLIAPIISHLRGEADAPHLTDVLTLELLDEEASEHAEPRGAAIVDPEYDDKAESLKTSHKLDPVEFQEFLQRQKPGQSGTD